MQQLQQQKHIATGKLEDWLYFFCIEVEGARGIHRSSSSTLWSVSPLPIRPSLIFSSFFAQRTCARHDAGSIDGRFLGSKLHFTSRRPSICRKGTVQGDPCGFNWIHHALVDPGHQGQSLDSDSEGFTKYAMVWVSFWVLLWQDFERQVEPNDSTKNKAWGLQQVLITHSWPPARRMLNLTYRGTSGSSMPAACGCILRGKCTANSRSRWSPSTNLSLTRGTLEEAFNVHTQG